MIDEHPLQYISVFPIVNIKISGKTGKECVHNQFPELILISKTLTAKLPISMMKTICRFIIYYRFQISNYKTLI